MKCGFYIFLYFDLLEECYCVDGKCIVVMDFDCLIDLVWNVVDEFDCIFEFGWELFFFEEY